jgi:hypothetical protein
MKRQAVHAPYHGVRLQGSSSPVRTINDPNWRRSRADDTDGLLRELNVLKRVHADVTSRLSK